MNVEDKGSNTLVICDARSGFRREMLVISTPVDPEDTAERLNAVLETQFMDSV